MERRSWFLALWLALPGAPALAGGAEDPPEEPPPAEDPVDVGEEAGPPGVWSWFNIIGFPFYGAETGLGLFVGALITSDLPGNESGERPSIQRIAGSITTRRQYALSLAPEAWLAGDRLHVGVPMEYAYFPATFFGVGNNSRLAQPEAYTEHRLTVHAEVVAAVWGGLMLGPQYSLRRHNVTVVEEGGRLDGGGVAGAQGPVLLSGLGGLAVWDDRDDALWTTRGGVHRLGATAFHPALGSDVTFTRLELDARQFFGTWRDHVVALQVAAMLNLGREELPFQANATLGGDLLLRGWYGGRLRDRHSLAAQAEYRLPLSALFAVVGFVGAGQVASTLDELALRRTRVGAGAGVRLSLRRDERVNLRLDIAYGERPGFYFQVLEAI